MDISLELLNLRDVLKNVHATFKSSVKGRGLTLNMKVDPALPKEIKTDAKRLRQILINIIGNAIKYTSKGGVTVNVTSVGSDPTPLLGIYVEDTGCGIADDEVANIFQPFARLERTTKKNIRGTGLGLELSKRLAKLLGGDVQLVKSKVDIGSTFLITINPGVKLDDPTPIVSKSVKATEIGPLNPPKQPRLDGVKILVAEDTPDQGLLIRLFLTSAGAQVEMAENGAIAVEKALSDNFDITLMDMQMPVLSGYEATEHLRKSGFKKPIIALTAQAIKGDKERCLESGCTSHLAKPFTQELLVNEITRCISKKPPSELT
jgi:CheY-like chemotaxis protein